MTTIHEVTFASLHEHQDFVRSLARSLVRDPHAAEDVAQDTWLTFLRRPPRLAGAVRGWLAQVVQNRARNRHREATRRAVREDVVARARDVVDSDAVERLEIQQRVVAAVLALDEPQRTTLLLHYFEGLTAQAIAQRLGVPAGTVRSRISRALADLRERLDRQDPRGRAAWLPGVTMLAGGGETVAVGAVVWVGVAFVAAAAVVASVSFWSSPVPEVPVVGTTLANAAADVKGPDADSTPTDAPSRDGAGERIPVAAEPAVVLLPDPDFAVMPLPEVRRVVAWIQHLLRQRLLVPAAEIVGPELASFASRGAGGATRLLRREWAHFESNDAVGVREGGSYWSFVQRSHSYDDQTELSLEQGQYGPHRGRSWLLPIGNVPLADVAAAAPAAFAGNIEAYELLWQPSQRDGEVDAGWLASVQKQGLDADRRATADTTYMLRRSAAGERDALFAFRVVDTDTFGHTLVFRELAVFARGEVPPARLPARPDGEVPEWLTGRDVEALLATLRRVRGVAQSRLLAVAAPVQTAHADWLLDPANGLCRVLELGRFDALTTERCGASGYSFAKRSHDWNAHEICLNGGTLRVQCGFVVDLGAVALRDAAVGIVGEGGNEQQARWLRAWRPTRVDGSFAISDAEAVTATVNNVDDSAFVVVGHCYLLRTVESERSDLVLVHVLAKDEDAATFAFRILESQ